MMLTTRNLLLYAFLHGVVKAENIMLAKPCEVSETYWNADNANDGSNDPGSVPARTWPGVNPYWQGDLQGYFTIHNISVTSDVSYGYGKELGGAYVEVHADGNSGCPDKDVFICGQCPEVVGKGETFTFDCSHPRPVRFVKIWRNLTGELVVSEVVVRGTPVAQRVTMYSKEHNIKVSTPVTSLAVTSAAECSSRCHAVTSCHGFSYHPSADPNCLLATNPEVTATVVGWSKYTIDRCSSYDSCE